ncbi:MAG TPA: sugar ABC transporter permease [Tepidisphaeraceae bacterium]|jgi:ABC-type sugar transport system permease subunit
MTRDRWWALQQKYAPYLFVAPFVVLFCVFLLYPLGRSVTLSFYKAVGPKHTQFAGLHNYRFLVVDKLFWIAVANTVAFTIGYLIIQIPAALALALLVNSKRIWFRNFFRLAFFSPQLVGSVFVAVIFSLLFAQRHGLVNRAVGTALPFIGTEINWLGDPRLAMPAVIIAALWLSIGYAMIYFLAALQCVDRDLYEAAEVDGAGWWSQFWHVTLPSIRPVLVFLILVGTIGSFQVFELPYVMFRPTVPPTAVTIVMYLFQTGFESGDIGYASAIGWALVFMILIISLIQLRVTGLFREDAR